jgi:hypothetical protein
VPRAAESAPRERVDDQHRRGAGRGHGVEHGGQDGVAVGAGQLALALEQRPPALRIDPCSCHVATVSNRRSRDKTFPADEPSEVGQDRMKANRSALIVPAWVVGMPCGNPS